MSCVTTVKFCFLKGVVNLKLHTVLQASGNPDVRDTNMHAGKTGPSKFSHSTKTKVQIVNRRVTDVIS